MKCILVVSLTDIKNDPRVYRQVSALSKQFNVITAGYTPSGINGVKHIQLYNFKTSLLAKFSFAFWSLLGFYKLAILSIKKYKFAFEQIKNVDCDAILANDITSLPICAWTISRSKSLLIYDAHEYSPRQFEDLFWWKLLIQRLYINSCRKYLGEASLITTVCDSLAKEYESTFNIKVEVIINAPRFHDLSPQPVKNDKISIIHHGGANKSRKIEKMIELSKYLDSRFHLYFMLVGVDKKYISWLKSMVSDVSNVTFLDPVTMEQLPEFCNKFDIGLFLLEPTNFNYKNALPNKFFEYMQSRLAIAIGPSHEMVNYINKYKCGIYSRTFNPSDLANKLNSLTAIEIEQFKKNSDMAAKIENFDIYEKKFLKLVSEVF